jgi:hypothetical protein
MRPKEQGSKFAKAPVALGYSEGHWSKFESCSARMKLTEADCGKTPEVESCA